MNSIAGRYPKIAQMTARKIAFSASQASFAPTYTMAVETIQATTPNAMFLSTTREGTL